LNRRSIHWSHAWWFTTLNRATSRKATSSLSQWQNKNALHYEMTTKFQCKTVTTWSQSH
jgi:hypothetical protein